MKTYQCIQCLDAHSEENVSAVCSFCYDSLNREVNRLRKYESDMDKILSGWRMKPKSNIESFDEKITRSMG
jgi:hypothetical protein